MKKKNPKQQANEAYYYRLIEDSPKIVSERFKQITLTAHISESKDVVEMAISSAFADLQDQDTLIFVVIPWFKEFLIPLIQREYPNKSVAIYIFSYHFTYTGKSS